MDKTNNEFNSLPEKYIKDRIDFCLENQQMINFQMRLKGPSSFSKVSSSQGEVIEFTFDPIDENFYDFEKPFIKLFLAEKLIKIGQTAVIKDSLEYNRYTNSFYMLKTLICGDLKISLIPHDKKLVKLIESIIRDYNSAIEFLENSENDKSLDKDKCRKLVENGKFNNGQNG